MDNLDAMSLEDLDAYYTDDSRIEKLRDYARHKAAAIRAKLSGDLDSARRYEDMCDSLYVKLPRTLQW